ncbi:MAG TPA: hypothetical protein VLZ89_01465 [Anaerolineales bacterium]|nr:hypothetical protein [Anaerolineales bacterium]
MSRKFITANYEETLKQPIQLGEALPENHLARFMVEANQRAGRSCATDGLDPSRP